MQGPSDKLLRGRSRLLGVYRRGCSANSSIFQDLQESYIWHDLTTSVPLQKNWRTIDCVQCLSIFGNVDQSWSNCSPMFAKRWIKVCRVSQVWRIQKQITTTFVKRSPSWSNVDQMSAKYCHAKKMYTYTLPADQALPLRKLFLPLPRNGAHCSRVVAQALQQPAETGVSLISAPRASSAALTQAHTCARLSLSWQVLTFARKCSKTLELPELQFYFHREYTEM